MESIQSTKIQGDKLEIYQETARSPQLDLGHRPVDADLEKKQGDPLYDAIVLSPQSARVEVHHTAKLARELPEYHQGEAHLIVETHEKEVTNSDVLAAQATLMVENAKELAEESKELVEEKAHGLYESAVEQADVLLGKAYQGEQYLVEKAVDAEIYLEEKGKQAKKKAEDILVNTIAPAVGYALGSAYVALGKVTGVALEKGKEGAEQLKEEATVIGQEMAKEAWHLKEEAMIKGPVIAEKTMEGLAVAAELGKDTLAVAAEKTMEGLTVAAELGKDTLAVAAEKTNQTMDYIATKGDQTLEYMEKEAAVLSREGQEFLHHQKENLAAIAEEAKHNVEAATLLRELAEETEIKQSKPQLIRRTSSDRAEDFMNEEMEAALKLRREHDRAAKEAAQKAIFIQHEKAFEDAISKDLTSSLRQSHIEQEERQLEEGLVYQPLIETSSPLPVDKLDATKGELQPLLPHVAQQTIAEPRNTLNV